MKRCALGLLLALAAGSASAQAYFGAGGGLTYNDVDCRGTLRCDREDTGFKAYGGFMFTPVLGAEVVYFDLGRAAASVPFNGTVAEAEVETTALGLALAFNGLIANNLTGHARLGLANVDSKGTARIPGAFASEMKSSGQAFVGLGLGFHFAPNAALRADYDAVGAKDIGNESYTATLLSVGVGFRF
jgi:OOP family OmpA-OmpF porin